MRLKKFFSKLGPGLITGASDDDPSGIGTYSQAGAQFGVNILWTMVFTFPLMFCIQEISARIGRITGKGLAGNLKDFYPPWISYFSISCLVLANTLNIGADLGAMGAALELVCKGPLWLYTFGFSVISIYLIVQIPYSRYVKYLRWLTLSLFAYVGTAFLSKVPWAETLRGTFIPTLHWNAQYLSTAVAILGTTISPYLFFWQASQEIEELHLHRSARPLIKNPKKAPAEFERIRFDTFVGMGFSNVIAFFIMLTSAVTLHTAGITDIETASQAASALKPLAGNLAFLLFSLGIIGTGLLAIPILAGSSAYALGEIQNWPIGLEKKATQAKRFYLLISISVLTGLGINFLKINPIKALFWSAAINGIAAVPIMFVVMHMAMNKKVVKNFKLPLELKIGGILATLVMLIAVVLMGWTQLCPT